MGQDASIPPVLDWERDLIRDAVQRLFAEAHWVVVLAELERMRTEWCANKLEGRMSTAKMVQAVVRTQMDVIEESAGDPAYLTEENYRRSFAGETNRERLSLLDQIIEHFQRTAQKRATEGRQKNV